MLNHGELSTIYTRTNQITSTRATSVGPRNNGDIRPNADILNKYEQMKQELERHILPEKSIESTEEISVDDIPFLQLTIRTREKISILKQKYQDLGNENVAVREKIAQIKKLMEDIMKDDADYRRLVCFYNIEAKESQQVVGIKGVLEAKEPLELTVDTNVYIDSQLNHLGKILLEEEKKVVTNEDTMCDLLKNVQVLKNILTIPTEEMSMEKSLTTEEASKALCVICSTRSIRFGLSACGHCFCEDCIGKMTDKCHVCRSIISPQIKLFYD